MTPAAIKVRENMARRKADRRFGLRLTKSTRRDPGALDFGLFALTDPKTGKAINPPLRDRLHSWTLEEVETFLNETQPNPKRSPRATHARSIK